MKRIPIIAIAIIMMAIGQEAWSDSCGSIVYLDEGSISSGSVIVNPPSPSLPDFRVTEIWIEDRFGEEKTKFLPNDKARVHVKVKNYGADSPTDIDIKYKLSEGEERSSDAKTIAKDSIRKEELKSGKKREESAEFEIPDEAGTYNITVEIDTGHKVKESSEGNNRSQAHVFVVDDLAWLQPLMQMIINAKDDPIKNNR